MCFVIIKLGKSSKMRKLLIKQFVFHSLCFCTMLFCLKISKLKEILYIPQHVQHITGIWTKHPLLILAYMDKPPPHDFIFIMDNHSLFKNVQTGLCLIIA